MAKFYALRIMRKKMKLEDVPKMWRDETRRILIEEYGWEEPKN